MGRFEKNKPGGILLNRTSQHNLSGSTHTSLLISLLWLPQCTNVFLKRKLGQFRTIMGSFEEILPMVFLLNQHRNKSVLAAHTLPY